MRDPLLRAREEVAARMARITSGTFTVEDIGMSFDSLAAQRRLLDEQIERKYGSVDNAYFGTMSTNEWQKKYVGDRRKSNQVSSASKSQ